jgi:hypothetical protein
MVMAAQLSTSTAGGGNAEGSSPSTSSCNNPAHDGIPAQIAALQTAVAVLQGTVSSQQGTISSQQGMISSQQGMINSQQGMINSQQSSIDKLLVPHHRIALRGSLISEVLLLAKQAQVSVQKLDSYSIWTFHDARAWIKKEQGKAQSGGYAPSALLKKLPAALVEAQREANSIASDDIRKRVRKVAKFAAHPDLSGYSDSELMAIASGHAFPVRVQHFDARTGLAEYVVTKDDVSAVMRLFIHARSGAAAAGGSATAAPANPDPAPP